MTSPSSRLRLVPSPRAVRAHTASPSASGTGDHEFRLNFARAQDFLVVDTQEDLIGSPAANSSLLGRSLSAGIAQNSPASAASGETGGDSSQPNSPRGMKIRAKSERLGPLSGIPSAFPRMSSRQIGIPSATLRSHRGGNSSDQLISASFTALMPRLVSPGEHDAYDTSSSDDEGPAKALGSFSSSSSSSEDSDGGGESVHSHSTSHSPGATAGSSVTPGSSHDAGAKSDSSSGPTPVSASPVIAASAESAGSSHGADLVQTTHETGSSPRGGSSEVKKVKFSYD
jgi:hypothetical protein